MVRASGRTSRPPIGFGALWKLHPGVSSICVTAFLAVFKASHNVVQLGDRLELTSDGNRASVVTRPFAQSLLTIANTSSNKFRSTNSPQNCGFEKATSIPK